MRKALDLRVFCLLFAALACQSAFAKFFPVNGGMVNQATVLTANILTPSTFVATGNQVIVVEGSDNQILKLPNATKLPLDWWYRVLNNSTGYVTVRDGSGADIASVNTTRAGEFYLKGRSSAAGTWKKQVSASATELDANYYLKTDFVSVSAGLSSAGKPIKLNGSGQVDATMLPASSGIGWALTGNSGLSAAANYLGTNDAVDLVFKTNGVEWFRITSAGALTTQLAGGLVKSTAGVLGLGVSDTDYQAPITLTTFGSTPNNNGLTFSADVLSMQPADATHPGGVSTAAQSFAGAKTFLDAATFSVAGAASLPGLLISGTPYSAGSITSNKPQFFMEWGSPTTNTWNPNGTAFGVNAAAAFTGKLLDLKINGNTVMSVDYGNGTSANQGSGVFIRNVLDNSNGGLVLCGQTGAITASPNCLSLYQSNAGTFSLFSLDALQGAYKIFNTNNSYADIAFGGVTAVAAYTYEMIVQNQSASAYNAATTLAVRAAATQTGDLQRWESNAPATLAKVDINGKGFFAGVQDTAFSSAGVVTNDASGNLASVVPGTSGNVLMSNGSAWVSSAAAGGGCVAPVLTKTSGYTILTSDFTCANKVLNVEANCSADCAITFPAASNSGYEVRLINIGTATATATLAGSDTFGTTADQTWILPAGGSPQSSNTFWANGGSRWNGM